MKKTCEVCKKAFETNKSFMKYCSIECQKIIYKVKRPMYYKKHLYADEESYTWQEGICYECARWEESK